MVQTAPLLLAVALASQSATPIADPRPASAVLDTTGTLTAAERSAIDDAASRVRESGRGELLVVVVHSIAPADPRTYATELFNRWRIGDASRHDGVLVFAALDDRAAELILGSGVESDAQVAASEAIMQEVMVPRFREGRPGLALLHGAWAAGERILGVPLGPLAAESPADADDEGTNPDGDATPTGGVQLQDAPPGTSASSRDVPWGPLGLGGGAAGLLSFFVRRTWWRRRPRPCPSCRKPMVRLGEAEDDAHLSSGEQAEERVGSVDYDIWHCADCNQAEKVRWGALFTRYAACPKCGSVTKGSTTTTLERATYISGGLVRVTERCAHCDYTDSYTRSTPRLERSSSSSYSSSRSSSRSSGSSSFRSGGGSSGRGSSGRW